MNKMCNSVVYQILIMSVLGKIFNLTSMQVSMEENQNEHKSHNRRMVSLIRLSLTCSIAMAYVIKLSVIMYLHGSITSIMELHFFRKLTQLWMMKKHENWNGVMT